MFFFNDYRSLLKHSGVTGDFLIYNRFDKSQVDIDAFDADVAVADIAADVAAKAAKYADDVNADATATADDVKAAEDAAKDAAKNSDAANNIKAHKVTNAAATAEVVAVAKERAKLFKPFESKTDAALSLSSIISAPVCLILLALDEMASFIVSGLKSIAKLVTLNPESAKELSVDSAIHLLNSFKNLALAAMSPVVNTVDFVGSCVTTVTEVANDNENSGNTYQV